MNELAATTIRDAVDQLIHGIVLRECRKATRYLMNEDDFLLLVKQDVSVSDIAMCLQDICERTERSPHGSSDYSKCLRVDSLLRIITVQRNHHTEALVWNSAGS